MASEATEPGGPKYPDVRVNFDGADGNVFSLGGRCGLAAKRAGVPRDEIGRFYAEVSAAGSYDDALRVMMAWFDVD